MKAIFEQTGTRAVFNILYVVALTTLVSGCLDLSRRQVSRAGGAIATKSLHPAAAVSRLSSSSEAIPVTDQAIPKLGESYTDASFNTVITRLSDAAVEGVSSVTNFYSAISAFNSDDTYVLTQRTDGVCQVRDLRGNIIRNHLEHYGILPLGNPIWSRTDPNVIYFHSFRGNQIMSYNVSSNQVTALYAVSGASEISFSAHSGDVSADGDHIAIVTNNMRTYIFQISTRTLSGGANVQPNWFGPYSGTSSFDYGTFFGITPGNNFFVDLEASEGSGGAIDYFNGASTYTGRAAAFGGHGDSAGDVDGSDAFVVTNSSDYNPISACPNGIVKVRTPGSAPDNETCLTPGGLDWNLVSHVSCNNERQGWCLVSTYSAYEPGGQWPVYTNELFIVPLIPNGSVYRLAHSRSSNKTYDSFPKASLSHSGRYALFNSDMAGRTDIYLVAIPEIPDFDAGTPPTPSPSVPLSGPPMISAAGTGCSDGYCIWILGTSFSTDSYVDIRPNDGTWNIISSIRQDLVRSHSGSQDVLTARISDPVIQGLLASQGLNLWVVNPTQGTWSNGYTVFRPE